MKELVVPSWRNGHCICPFEVGEHRGYGAGCSKIVMTMTTGANLFYRSRPQGRKG